MAWNDTTHCPYCGREIPMLRRMSKGQFCSKAHADAYLQQQTQMAVEVLHRTHDALKAYRPTNASIEDILGVRVEEPVSVQRSPVPAPPAEVPAWTVPPVARAARETREFDVAALAALADLAGLQETRQPAAPKNPATPEVGDAPTKRKETSAASWWRRILATLWPTRLVARS